MIDTFFKIAFQKNKIVGMSTLYLGATIFSALIYFILNAYFGYLISSYENQYREEAQTHLEKKFPEFVSKSKELLDQELTFIEADLNVIQGIAEALDSNKTRFKDLYRLTQKVDFLKNQPIPKKKELKNKSRSFIVPLSKASSVPSIEKAERTALLDIYIPQFLKAGSGSKSQGFAYIDNKAGYARVYGKELIERLASEEEEIPFVFKEKERRVILNWFSKNEKNPLLYFSQSTGSLSYLYPVSSKNKGPITKFILIRNDLRELKQLIDDLEFNKLGFAFLFDLTGKDLVYAGRDNKKFGDILKKQDLISYQGDAPKYFSYSEEEFFFQRIELQENSFITDKGIQQSSFKFGFVLPVEGLVKAFSKETRAELESNIPAFPIATCIWFLLVGGLSIYFWTLQKTKKQLVNLSNKLDQNIASLEQGQFEKGDFSFIFLSIKRARKKIQKQEIEINFLESSYKNTIAELSGLIENFINDINFVFNVVSKGENQSSVVLGEIFQNIIQLNQLQSSVIKIYNGLEQQEQLPEITTPSGAFSQQQDGKNHTVNKAFEHNQIYLYGFEPSTLTYFQKFLKGVFQNDSIKSYRGNEEFVFLEDRKILFIINSNISKNELESLSGKFLQNPDKFLVTFLDSQMSPLSNYAPKFLKPLINNRVLFLSNYLHIKDLYELSVINLRFKKLTEFTKSIYAENKIEQILSLVQNVLTDLFPNLKVAFSRREKFILPEEEEIEVAEKEKFNAVKEIFYRQEQEIFQCSENQYYYYCGEFQTSKTILMIIECNESFGRIQKSIFDNVFHITNNRFQNFNPLLREPKYINIIRKIIQDFEKIEYLKSSRQYSVIQYLDKNKTTKIERIPMYILADYLKGYFVQPNRSYLVNPSKIKKIISKDKKYSIPLSNDEASIYKNFLKDFKSLFPYWFDDIED